MKKRPLLLGITGAFASGKSTAAVFFVSKGFARIELSSFLAQEIRQRSQEKITRKHLQDEGNKMRAKYGAGILAKKALEQIEQQKQERVVIDGIRNMSEVEALCSNPNFLLLAVVSDRAVRFNRLQEHPRREALDLQTFAKLDYRDLGIGEKDTGLQTGMCIALADVYIENNGNIAEFEKKLAKYTTRH